jgi:hypothetical protein
MSRQAKGDGAGDPDEEAGYKSAEPHNMNLNSDSHIWGVPVKPARASLLTGRKQRTDYRTGKYSILPTHSS